MPKESEHFCCPFCGQHAPVERILEDGPFEAGLFEKTLGGKVALTREEKASRRPSTFHRGAAPGKLNYVEIPMTPEVEEAIQKRAKELYSQYA